MWRKILLTLMVPMAALPITFPSQATQETQSWETEIDWPIFISNLESGTLRLPWPADEFRDFDVTPLMMPDSEPGLAKACADLQGVATSSFFKAHEGQTADGGKILVVHDGTRVVASIVAADWEYHLEPKSLSLPSADERTYVVKIIGNAADGTEPSSQCDSDPVQSILCAINFCGQVFCNEAEVLPLIVFRGEYLNLLPEMTVSNYIGKVNSYLLKSDTAVSLQIVCIAKEPIDFPWSIQPNSPEALQVFREWVLENVGKVFTVNHLMTVADSWPQYGAGYEPGRFSVSSHRGYPPGRDVPEIHAKIVAEEIGHNLGAAQTLYAEDSSGCITIEGEAQLEGNACDRFSSTVQDGPTLGCRSNIEIETWANRLSSNPTKYWGTGGDPDYHTGGISCTGVGP